MTKELEFWQFVDERLKRGEAVMLLVVAESSGSSPGRQGYKMAVGERCELFGSIGGGVMEVDLVEEARRLLLLDAGTRGPGDSGTSTLSEKVHRKDAANASGMICSGKQTVILKLITPEALDTVRQVIRALRVRRRDVLNITPDNLTVQPPEGGTPDVPQIHPPVEFQMLTGDRSSDKPKSKIQNLEFAYAEQLGFGNDLYIIGGGHCALALSEIMSKMDFHISLFDDRPDLNTIEKNRFAHEIKIIDGYDRIGEHVTEGGRTYVVVMTLGYKSDAEVIRALIDKRFKYFGVLGSNAKMATMLRELVKEGLSREMLDRIRTPVGIPINSRTPEEIAVSIAAEIISVKNAE